MRGWARSKHARAYTEKGTDGRLGRWLYKWGSVEGGRGLEGWGRVVGGRGRDGSFLLVLLLL